MAANTEQFRHVMTQTFCQCSDFRASLSWLRAGGNLSRHNYVDQYTDHPLLRSEHLPKSAAAFPDSSRSHFGRVGSASRIQSRPA